MNSLHNSILNKMRSNKTTSRLPKKTINTSNDVQVPLCGSTSFLVVLPARGGILLWTSSKSEVNLLYTYRDCIWNNVRNTTGKRQPWDLIFQYGVTINYEVLWMLTNQPHKSFKMAAAIQPSLKNSRNALFALHVWLSVYVWTSIGIFNK